MKINTICFILLFFFLISAVSAVDNKNETIECITQLEPVENNREELKIEDLDTPENENKAEEILSSSIESESATISKTIESENKISSQNIKQELSKTYTAPLGAKLKVTLKAPDVKMHYKDGTKFKVTLKDNFNKAMKNTKVKISINGATYTKTTDSKGVAQLALNQKSGNYNVVTTYDGSKTYAKQSVKSTVTIKSTIKCSDFSKYYKNTAAYYSTFYDIKGKLLKDTSIKFKLNSKTYSVKTNAKGVGKLEINLKPGKYSISSINSKTSETITKTITIKTTLETQDLNMKDGDGSKFNVKILNCYGKASSNKKVTFKVTGKTYTKTTNQNGIASLPIDLEVGKYTIVTEYDGLKNTNQITVNKVIKKTLFSHITLIPNYVNVTNQYVFYNSAYALKTGLDGIIRMPKNDVITIQISENKSYLFSHTSISGLDTIVIGYKTHLIPFDGSPIKSDYDKDNLKGNGILISVNTNYTQIEYRSVTEDNTDLFGVYFNGNDDQSEIITYMQNNKIKAKIRILTLNYDEMGVKYNLGKFYGKSIYDFNYKSYDEITNHNTHLIKFTNTAEPVTFSYFGNSITGCPSKENITTKFVVNGVEELEKQETISRGLSERYRQSLGFEVLQSYAIINERMTKNILQNWVSKNTYYLNKFGIMNVYGMFLASLETAWLADEVADEYAKEYNVNWKRTNTLTILGGINLEDTYLNVLNADMGMGVTGNSKNVQLFRLINSLNLPNIEDYVLEPVAERYMNQTSNSLDTVLESISNNNFSITQIGEMLYVFSGNDSAIVLNTTSGVSNVILSHGNSVYKGSQLHTSEDCCGVGVIPQDVIQGIKEAFKIAAPGLYLISDHFKKVHGLSLLAYTGLKLTLSRVLTGVSSAALGLFTSMAMIQGAGATYRDKIVDNKKWHETMDSITFTRPGYLQGKKIYNIPNNNGGYDYIEVKINDDLSLDRNSAKYISDGQTKQLTKEETYQYFSEDYWTPFSMPTKYWDKSWK